MRPCSMAWSITRSSAAAPEKVCADRVVAPSAAHQKSFIPSIIAGKQPGSTKSHAILYNEIFQSATILNLRRGAIMAVKRIGILTGGGDVPGLNSVIKTVVYRGSEIGCEVIGIRRGWEGLTHVNLQDPASRTRYVLPLNRENTRTIDRTGGTYLHSSRTNPSKMKKLPPVLEGQDFPVNEF